MQDNFWKSISRFASLSVAALFIIAGSGFLLKLAIDKFETLRTDDMHSLSSNLLLVGTYLLPIAFLLVVLDEGNHYRRRRRTETKENRQ